MTFGRWKLALIIVIAVAMAALVLAHVHDLNGPWYWKWPWRRLGWGIYPLMLAAASPIVAAQWLFARRNVRAARLVPLLMLAALLAQAAAMSQQPLGLRRVKAIVENSVNTSYYNA